MADQGPPGGWTGNIMTSQIEYEKVHALQNAHFGLDLETHRKSKGTVHSWTGIS